MRNYLITNGPVYTSDRQRTDKINALAQKQLCVDNDAFKYMYTVGQGHTEIKGFLTIHV